MKKCKIVAGLLTLLFMLASVCFMQPDGSEVIASGNNNAFHVVKSLDISDYKKVNADGSITSTIPKAEGEYADWIFAGWYKNETCTSAVGKDTVEGNYHAKFVPAEVLSIKCQTNADITSTDDTAKIRVVSTVDSVKYSQVGFDLQFKGKEISYQTSTVLSSIQAAKDGVEYGFSPNIFDLQSKYFITATIVNIQNEDFDEGLLMKPYWVTKDGTKVYGVERYARVEDSYLHIVNVPVRLVSDNVQAQSGTVTVTYDNAKLQFASSYTGTIKNDVPTTTPGFVTGGEFTVEAAGTEGTVTVTGSAVTMQSTDGMFAHLRFKALDANGVLPKTNIFEVEEASFIDAGEATVTGVAAVDSVYKYYNTAKTSQSDKDWFNGTHVKPGTTEFVITSPDELYGLAELVNGGYITTEKIYLGADITVNTGTIVSKEEDGTITINKTYDWTPIGAQASGKKFAGTFDGQEHTIRGLHTNVSTAASNKYYAGLFGTIETTSKVKNFRIENSYFKASDYAGSVAGCLASGTIENVYSEAYVETSGTAAGGVVGISNGTGASSVEKCWFKGTVTAKSLICGGIVGVANGNNNTKNIINCLNEGDVIGTQWVGGLVGRVVDNGATIITNSLNMGNVSGNSVVGSVVGNKQSTCTINNVYALTADKGYAIGSDSANKEVTTFTNANKNTYYGYKALDVLRNKWDFDNTWVVREDNTPVLKTWCESGALYTPATTWAGGTGTKEDPYVIKTASQLYKLANDVNAGTTYDNTFFKLGANITVNGGTASAWETNAPKYNWITIGKQGKQHFKGSLDGANYTIKGLYIVDTSTAVGLFVDPDEVIIENLKVTNSYLKGGIGTAAVVGWYGGGTFNSIYSDAIVVSTGAHGAGLVSLVDQADTSFTNCWFDGSLTTGDFSGGIVSCNTKNINLTNCLNTGSVTSTGSTGQVGGMIGRVADNVVMSDCLNTGTISGLKHTASIIGFNNYVSIKVERVYALESSHELTCANDANVQAKVVTVADVTGGNGYLNTYLNFDRPELPVPTTGAWVARKNNVPGLKSLVNESDVLSLDGNNMYRADTRWYENPVVDAQGRKTYTIQTAEELVGFASLVNDNISFSGEVVSLGADITVNAETMNSNTSKASVYQWTPIGTKGKKFSGTFDGQGHTITGLYSDISNATEGNATSGYWYAGFFGTVNTTATIKDFSIKNSYFKANHYAGSVAGLLEAGTIENVYSEATIETRLTGAGGIVGQINSSSACTIQNDWFKGSVKAGSLVGGGIVGTVGGSQSIHIKNCMNEGPVSGKQWIGGLAGNVTAATNITECLSIGTVTGTKELGAAIGRNVSTCVAKSVYAIGTLKAVGAGTAIAEISVLANQSDLAGAKGYLNTYLTFDRPELPVPTTGAWVIRKDDVPGLKSFVNADDILTLDGSNMYRVDKRWLNEAGSETIDDVTYATYIIDTPEEFIGFSNHVTGGNDLANSIVYLGADIALNKGTVDEWETNSFAGLYTWSPIGTQASGKKFAGIFDGQGHTISGIYTNETNGSGLFGQIADGSKVTDFSLVNSCIVGRQGVGAICGWYAGGTFDTIYTDAKIIGTFGANSNSGHYGGFVGLVNANTKFQKCWFNGEMAIAGQYVGGIAGTIPNTGVQMTDCLNTGKMSCTFTGTDYQLGGLAGRVTQILTITNSLVACDEKIDVKATAEKVGSVLGYVGAAGTNTNVYALEKVYGNKAIGNGTTAAPTICSDLNNYKGYMNTNLDFDNTWVAMENSAPVLQNFAPEEGQFDTTSWYVKAGDGVGTSEENPYLLDSVADMYGFAKRANASTDGFADKYFKLTSSVNFNDGNPTDGEWATTAPYYVWTPIGNSSVYFKGHFDGGNHTISGLYVKNEDSTSNKALWYVGLFGCANDATIKNMSVEDSYFYASYYAAPIAGLMKGGEINNVYSNAIVNVSTGFGGGIAGCLEGGTIQNVWFQGTVSGLHYAGGIVGVNTTTQGYIKHALSDGTVSITGGQAGGIIGRVNNALEVQDSLSMSTVTAANTNRGAIAGYVTNTGNLNMTSAYGYCKANVTNGATAATAGKETNGVIGGQNYEVFNVIEKSYDTALAGKLDASKWTFRVGNYPIPATLAEGVVTSSDYSVAAAKDAAYVIDTDLSGSGTEDDPIQITSAEELYGLAVRSQAENFEGKTIELTSDITINTEDTTKENVTFYEWMPISDRTKPFAGTFKGNGHTISGLYRTYKTWETSWIGMFEMTADTSVINNFNIKNTYFAYTGTSDATRIGSVAGEGYGTFDSIYSNATLKSGGVGVGGILGVVVDAGSEANITNCWYDGEIIGTRTGDAHLGGMIGFVYDGGVANVTHSLYSGNMQADLGRKNGGVVGYVNTGGTLTVTDCLITGGISGEQQVGIVAGRVKSATDATSTLRINATWGVNDVVSLDVGSTENAVIEGKTHISTAKDRFIGFIPDVDSTETLASQKADGEETGFDGWVMIKDGTPVLKSFVKEGGIKIPSDVYEYTTVVSALNPNSNYTNWFENTLEYEGDGNYLYTITGQSADVYTAYCDALTSAFNLHSSNTIEDVQNRIFTAKNDDLVVDVTYSPTNTIYITVSTGKILSEHLKGAVNYSAKENAVADGYTLTGDNQLPNVTFHMVEQVEHLNGSGSSYIIQLKNGHLIVIDGGVSAQAPYLFDYMKSLVKEEGKKPVIDAWIVSHCHRDHIGVFQTIWEDAYKTGEEYKDYAGQVYVNGIYFNEPSDALLTRYDYGDRDFLGYLKQAATLLKTSTNGTPNFYRMQTGQRYTFDDVTMDIMLSQELLSIADYDETADVNNCVQTDAINDTSTWCMFTIGTGNNAKKLLTAGDASYSGKNYMCDMYSMHYLTMDVMTALHHGFNTNLSKYSTMSIFTSGADLQEEFSQHITVESVVLYSYKHDMTEEETDVMYGDAYAVNWKYAKLNSSFIDYLASKPNSFSNGIAVSQDGNTTNRNYLYSGEGTSVLTFGNTITGELKTRISE